MNENQNAASPTTAEHAIPDLPLGPNPRGRSSLETSAPVLRRVSENRALSACPTCGRPISAPLGQGTGPRSGPPAAGLSVSRADGGSLASAAPASSGIAASGPVGPGNGSSLAISAGGTEIARLRPNSEASVGQYGNSYLYSALW